MRRSGIHSGGFYIYPRLTADAQYNDNIYATQNTGTADTIFHVTPEVAIKSNWSRNELDFYAHAMVNRYASHSTEDTTDYGVGASGTAGHAAPPPTFRRGELRSRDGGAHGAQRADGVEDPDHL